MVDPICAWRPSATAQKPGASQERPLVSIVTATLNQCEYLGQTIASVRAQSYPAIEHIIVDGGSTDGTLELLRQLDDPRVRWSSGPDDGMYHAINDGLRRARGEILTYLNSDDLLMPWTVARVADEFLQYPEADLVYGDALRYLQEVDEFDLILQPPFRYSTLGRTGSFVQPAVFWRRRLVDSIGYFDTRYRLSADLDFWLRASRKATFHQVDEVLAVERAHAAAQTARLRSRLGSEAGAIRSHAHRDRFLRLPLKLAARFADGVAARRRMLRLVRTLGTTSLAWAEFRNVCRPRVRWAWLVVAMLSPRPLVGTPPRALPMKVLRRRWIVIDEGRFWRRVSGEP